MLPEACASTLRLKESQGKTGDQGPESVQTFAQAPMLPGKPHWYESCKYAEVPE